MYVRSEGDEIVSQYAAAEVCVASGLFVLLTCSLQSTLPPSVSCEQDAAPS